MPADDVLPWKLLLSKLRRSDDSRVSYDEVLRTGWQAEPLVVRERVLEYGKADDYEPPGCLNGCLPNVNYELGAAEGLVAVACPEEPPCWPGWTMVPRTEVEALRCRAKDVFAKIAATNRLQPFPKPVPNPFLGVGMTHRRGMNIGVVWLRAPKLGFEQLCRGLRSDLGVEGLVVLVATKPPTSLTAADKIVPFELDLDAEGRIGLPRAIEELTPDYRTRVLDEPMLDLDYVHLRLSTRPGERHVVEINGQDFGGFRKSEPFKRGRGNATPHFLTAASESDLRGRCVCQSPPSWGHLSPRSWGQVEAVDYRSSDRIRATVSRGVPEAQPEIIWSAVAALCGPAWGPSSPEPKAEAPRLRASA